jgi:cation/acetate symporter
LTPVFVLAIWWRRTSAAGATAGMIVGATVAACMFFGALTGFGPGMADMLLTPTIVAAPLATVVTVLVSLRTSPPEDLAQIWVTLHGTAADRKAVRLAKLPLSSPGRKAER